MSVFAHKNDKGKFNLGDESDLNGIGDGTPFGAIKAIFNSLTKNKLEYISEVYLSNYSIGNPYTFPSDGYVQTRDNGGSDFAVICGADGTDATKQLDLYPPTTVFVRKGMKGWGSGAAFFYPLS